MGSQDPSRRISKLEDHAFGATSLVVSAVSVPREVFRYSFRGEKGGQCVVRYDAGSVRSAGVAPTSSCDGSLDL